MLKISMLGYLGGSALMFVPWNLPKRQDGAGMGSWNLGGQATTAAVCSDHACTPVLSHALPWHITNDQKNMCREVGATSLEIV